VIFTTTITVRRPDGDTDPYEEPTEITVATAVPAHISSPSGSDTRLGGERELVDAALIVATSPALTLRDEIDDERTGESWQVVWVRQRTGVGLDHQRAGLSSVKGAAA